MRWVLPLLLLVAPAVAKEALPRFRLPAATGDVLRPVPLTASTRDALHGRLDPAGARLAYSSDAKGNFEIWIRDLSTGAAEAITEHPTLDTMPAWSPDGDRLAFVGMRDDVAGDLFLWSGKGADRLTGREGAESFPAFGATGRLLYFAQRRVSDERIVRLDLSARERPPQEVAGPGTHPAVSADGRWLAFTRTEGVPRIALVPLRPIEGDAEKGLGEPTAGPVRDLVAAEDPLGFPSFSPDGRTLFFTRFHTSAPGAPIEHDAPAAVWAVPLAGWQDREPAENLARARRLTTDATAHLFAQGHAAGVVVTRSNAEARYDVELVSPSGVLRQQSSAAGLRALAERVGDADLELLALEGLQSFPPDEQTQSGLYRAASLRAKRGEGIAALRLATQVAAGPVGAWAERAACDAAVLPLEADGQADPQVMMNAELVLDRPASTPEGQAWCALRRADLQRAEGRQGAAAAAYRAVREAHPALAALAHVRLGTVLGFAGEPLRRAHHLLTAFERWPEAGEALAEAAQAALQVVAHEDSALERPALRALLDRYGEHPLFGVPALRRLGTLYAEAGEHALAAGTFEEAALRFGDLRAARAAAAHARALAGELRAAGRYNEASSLYDRALATLQKAMEAQPPGHPDHELARRGWLQLSLARAGQAERDGDREKALTLHRAVLDAAPDTVQSHRKIIQLSLSALKEKPDEAKAAWKALEAPYEARLDLDSEDALARYCLGYLHTWKHDLDSGDLSDAIDHLQRAADLDAASPFPPMTLAWAYLMKEQAFEDVKRPWALMALEAYERAWHLNDRDLDVQTEADILLSWGNAWVELGNGWPQAHKRYTQREALLGEGLTWLDEGREAMFHYRAGRAAFMVDAFAEAERHYELALAIARRRGAESLETLLVGQLALLYHVTGEYDRSNDLFARVRAVCIQEGRVGLLAGVTRAMAHNLVEKKDYPGAARLLEEAKRLLEQHGAPKISSFERVSITPGGSLFPLGFGDKTERHFTTGLKELLFRQSHATAYAAEQAREGLEQRQKLFEETGWPDMAQAAWLLQERVALEALATGDRRTFQALGEGVFDGAVKLQSDPERPAHDRFRALPEAFALMAAVLAHRNVQLLRDAERARMPDADQLDDHVERLLQMEEWRARHEGGLGLNVLKDDELRLSYITSTALVLVMAAHRALALSHAEGKPAAADDHVRTWAERSALVVRAVRLLRDAVARTLAQPSPALKPQPDLTGVPPSRRARWHVQALLDLADLVAWPDPARAGALLEQAQARCAEGGVDLGAACWLVEMELAFRAKDREAAERIVAAYVGTWGGLLGPAYASRSEAVRRRLFDRAMSLALDAGDHRRVLELAELSDRKRIADALADFELGSTAPALSEALDAIQEWTRYDERARANRDADDTRRREDGAAAMLKVRDPKLWARLWTEVEKVSPATRRLLDPEALPWKVLAQALGPKDAVVSAVPVGDRVVLFHLTRGDEGITLQHAVAPGSAREIRRRVLWGEQAAAQVLDLIGALPAPWFSQRQRVYFDLSRLGEDFPVEAFAARHAPKVQRLHLLGVQELAEAWRARNRYFDGGLAMASAALLGSALARVDLRLGAEPLGWKLLEREHLRLEGASVEMQAAGLQVWGQPVRVESDGLADVSVAMHAEVDGLEEYRFPKRLGEQLRASLVVVPAFHAGLDRRAGKQMLLAYLHAAGVPSVALAPTGQISPHVGRWLAGAGPALGKASAAEAFYSAPRPRLQHQDVGDDPEGRDVLRYDRLRLFGFAGLRPGLDAKAASAWVQAHFEEARQSLEAGDATRAIAPLRAAIAMLGRHPDFPERAGTEALLLDTLSQACVDAGRTEEAIRVQRRLVSNARAAAEAGGLVQRQALGQAWFSLIVMVRGRAGAMEEAKGLVAWLRTVRDAASKEEAAEWSEALIQTMELRASELEREGRGAEAHKAYGLAFAAAKKASATKPSLAATALLYAAEVARLSRDALGAGGRARMALDWLHAKLPEVQPPQTAAAEARLRALEPLVLAESDPAKRERLLDEGFALEQTLAVAELQSEARAAALTELARQRAWREDPWGAVQAADEALRAAVSDDRGMRALRAMSAALLALGRPEDVLKLVEAGASMKPALIQDRPRFEVWLALDRARALALQGKDPLPVLDAAKGAADVAGEPALQAAVARVRGDMLLAEGEVERASAAFLLAGRRAGLAGERIARLSDQIQASRALRLSGAEANALDLLRRVGHEAREKGATDIAAEVDLEEARLALASGDAAKALKTAKAANRRNLRPGLRWRLHLIAGQAASKRGDPAIAQAELGRAAALVERAGARLLRSRPGDLRPREIYDSLIAELVAKGKAAAALAVSERARARAFLDSAGPVKPDYGEGAGLAFARALVAWRDAEADLDRAPRKKTASRVLKREKAAAALATVSKAREALTEKGRRYPAWQAIGDEPASLETPAGHVLLAYHALPDALLLFRIEGGEVKLHRVDVGRRALAQQVDLFRRRMISFHSVEADAKALWTLLLAPVAEGLPKRVLVVPDGPLHALPFSALHDGKQAALDRFVFSALPSVGDLRLARPVGALQPETAAAFNWSGMLHETMPLPGTRKYLRRMEAWRSLRRDWPPLPFATRETDSFAQTWPKAIVYRDKEASLGTFRVVAPEADLLHLAAHAVYRPDDPTRSWIQLGGAKAGEAFPDFEAQRLTARDVLLLELKAKLVVLSACRTGLVPSEQSAGLLGLHGAFLTAGAESVVSSLWRVSDLSTGVLMKNLHRGLSTADPAEALRLAQLRVREQWPHPGHWAGFRLEGVGKP